ncbi:hypothetical protein ACFQDH_12890 [Flexivirga alba]|uniref:Uncharacterized protein n=1 Tax=Flexivirga alba TaxID=702742 RepID=A0ABW2AHL3_9MICO
MAVVVGYVPTKEGAAALRRAAAEAAVRQTPLIVLDSAHSDGQDQTPMLAPSWKSWPTRTSATKYAL